MTLTKNKLVINASKELSLSKGDMSKILELTLLLIKTNSKLRTVKVSKFGTFTFIKTPERIGRNPKTSESYIIPVSNKLNFKPSNKLKRKLN